MFGSDGGKTRRHNVHIARLSLFERESVSIMPVPFSLSRSTQPREIRRRIVGCRERLRRTRGTQKIDARATTSEGCREASLMRDAAWCDAPEDEEETPVSSSFSVQAKEETRTRRHLESGAKEEGIEA